MTTVKFTNKLSGLLAMMIAEGEHPILDWVKRGDATQLQMFNEGKSKCNNINKISRHKYAKAADIYLTKGGKIIWDKERYEYWHKVWEQKFGGRKMFKWDINHYE